jgi:hypothetical protein
MFWLQMVAGLVAVADYGKSIPPACLRFYRECF